MAKPQLRGAEGTKLTLKVGDQIPIISTSYTPIAGGGAAVNPLSSYQYKDVGVNIEMTPRVTLEGDILLDMLIDSSSRGNDVNIGGINIPSFGQRKVTTRLRLRDGESNLLAGLLREDERKSLSGFPGAIHVPVADINGLCLPCAASDGHPSRTPRREIIRNLDALPWPAWDLVDVEKYRSLWTQRHGY